MPHKKEFFDVWKCKAVDDKKFKNMSSKKQYL